MNIRLHQLLLASSLVTSLACAGAEVIGTAGSISIDATQIQALLAKQPEQIRRSLATDDAALEQLVRADLISRAVGAEANAAGFGRRPDVVTALDQMREEALVRMWVGTRAQVPESYPTEAEIKATYEQSRSQLRTPAEYHAAQIFVSAPDGVDAAKMSAALRKVQELSTRVTTGGDFAAVARVSSEHQESASAGGDLGWITEDRLRPAIAAALRALKPGEVAGPLKSDQGFHFIKLLELRPGREPTLEETRERLVAALRARRAQELAAQYEAELTARTSISINQIALKSLQKTLAPMQAKAGKDAR